VSDVKVEQKQTLSREEAARFIAALAEELSDDGNVTVRLGSSTLELSVASQLDCELEVSVDGDEIELELELKWSTSGRASAGAAEGEAEDDEAEDDEAEEDDKEEEEEDKARQTDREAEPKEHDSDEDDSGPDASAAGDAQDTGGDGDATRPVRAESPRAAPAGRAPRPRRARRRAPADTGRSASNGVDTAAVRAWAGANGLSVSPRGRIKDEVLQAYRDAGN